MNNMMTFQSSTVLQSMTPRRSTETHPTCVTRYAARYKIGSRAHARERA